MERLHSAHDVSSVCGVRLSASHGELSRSGDSSGREGIVDVGSAVDASLTLDHPSAPGLREEVHFTATHSMPSTPSCSNALNGALFGIGAGRSSFSFSANFSLGGSEETQTSWRAAPSVGEPTWTSCICSPAFVGSIEVEAMIPTVDDDVAWSDARSGCCSLVVDLTGATDPSSVVSCSGAEAEGFRLVRWEMLREGSIEDFFSTLMEGKTIEGELVGAAPV